MTITLYHYISYVPTSDNYDVLNKIGTRLYFLQ